MTIEQILELALQKYPFCDIEIDGDISMILVDLKGDYSTKDALDDAISAASEVGSVTLYSTGIGTKVVGKGEFGSLSIHIHGI